jgi:hypothetical protein
LIQIDLELLNLSGVSVRFNGFRKLDHFQDLTQNNSEVKLYLRQLVVVAVPQKEDESSQTFYNLVKHVKLFVSDFPRISWNFKGTRQKRHRKENNHEFSRLLRVTTRASVTQLEVLHQHKERNPALRAAVIIIKFSETFSNSLKLFLLNQPRAFQVILSTTITRSV